MKRTDRYAAIIEWFGRNMPVAESELNYSTPFELLVAVILSAQCTDKRVNMVTPALFREFPDAASMAHADIAKITELIGSISFPNNKARHLVGMAKELSERFAGIVPDDTELLQQLPGVGRKTANVVASVIFGKPVIAVDTHVYRVARRIGLSDGEDVRKVEDDLTANIPSEIRAIAHHWLILHGRYVCKARKPKCDECGISAWCRSRQLSLNETQK